MRESDLCQILLWTWQYRWAACVCSGHTSFLTRRILRLAAATSKWCVWNVTGTCIHSEIKLRVKIRVFYSWKKKKRKEIYLAHICLIVYDFWSFFVCLFCKPICNNECLRESKVILRTKITAPQIQKNELAIDLCVFVCFHSIHLIHGIHSRLHRFLKNLSQMSEV